MADIEDSGALDDAIEGVSEDAAREAANRWFSQANENLMAAGDQLDYEVFPVVQSARPPQWDSGEDAWVMQWPHTAAKYMEHGSTEHEVSASSAEYLAFEWPEMANEEFGNTGETFKEVFSDTWPTVFFKSVTVSGIPRIGFVYSARDDAKRWLRQQARE